MAGLLLQAVSMWFATLGVLRVLLAARTYARRGNIRNLARLCFRVMPTSNALVCITAQYSANLARPDWPGFSFEWDGPAETGRSQSEKEAHQ
jgi:hypothetical protein